MPPTSEMPNFQTPDDVPELTELINLAKELSEVTAGPPRALLGLIAQIGHAVQVAYEPVKTAQREDIVFHPIRIDGKVVATTIMSGQAWVALLAMEGMDDIPD